VLELYCPLSMCLIFLGLELVRVSLMTRQSYDKTVIYQRRVEKSAFED